MKAGFVKKGLLEIEFFHPKHNALPSNLLQELASSIDRAGTDDEVQVIILKSAGDRTFCAGASFNELVAISDFVAGKRFFMGFANVINACRKCPKMIIGRVHGKAVGGGVGLAAAADYCLATKYAGIKLSELNIGIGPFVIAPVVERKIGLSATSQLTIGFNEFQPAQWAMEKGLYAGVFESSDELDAAVTDTADSLLATNPEARSLLKGVFWEGCEHWDDLLEKRAEMSGRLILSDSTKRALAKYR